MQTTLKDLCAEFPAITARQSPLDNLTGEIFRQHHDQPYVQSTSLPDQRYGIYIDHVSSRPHNDIDPDFSEYGPNEQYLLDNIMYSPGNLLYVIGGIGVGKTRFSQFVINEVLPQVASRDEQAVKCDPCRIYYDFLSEYNVLPSDEDSRSVRAAFIDSFCDRVEVELYSQGFFDLDYEVSTIWDSLVEKNVSSSRKHVALSFIIRELRATKTDHLFLAEDYSETIQKRKTIRQKIRGDHERRISYIAFLLRYVKQHYFDKYPTGLMIIIDNLDHESSLVQQEVKLIIKPFARVSGWKTIVNLRQTTYYQQFKDDSSEPISVVPYCGPEPLDIVKSRIDTFLEDHSRFQEYYDPKYLPQFVDGVQNIRDTQLVNEEFKTLFNCICGRNVRRGLCLGQNIINNSVYDPSMIQTKPDGINQELVQIDNGDVLRALFVGTDDIYKSKPGKIIDNIFSLGSYPGEGNLIKLRVLKLLQCAGDGGVSITRMIDIMSGFGYTIPMVCDAVNELMSLRMSLVWSDSVRTKFRDEEDLVNQGSTLLFITTAGKGYIENLYTNINYIQEVMLDTQVEVETFGKGWKFNHLEDRFELLLKFLSLLWKIDQDEVSAFLIMKGTKEYINSFGSTDLLTKQMFIQVNLRIDRILSSEVANQRFGEQKNRLREFKIRQLGNYEDSIISILSFEHEAF